MLREKIYSKDRNEPRKGGRLWREQRRILISLLAFIALFPLALSAQDVQGSSSSCQGCVYGGGIQTPLLFEGESALVNQANLSVGASGFYDDNVLAAAKPRVADEAMSFDAHLGITKRSKRLVVNFGYSPFFTLYRTVSQYDRINHTGSLDMTYQWTSRIVLGVHETFSYQNGIYPSLTGQEITAGPAAPIPVDNIVVPYTTRTLYNMPGLDLTFAKSRRTSLSLSGVYSELKFGYKIAGQPLYNSNGINGGMSFQHTLTAHFDAGMSLLYQNTSYQGGQVFGNRLRTEVESAYLTLAYRVSSSISVRVFGGPQYLRTLGLASTKGRIGGTLVASEGANISKRVRSTAVDLAYQRAVNSSGGVYTSVISTTATLGVRRRLVGRWEAGANAGVAREDASIFQLGNGKTDGLLAGASITRPVARGSMFHISYFNVHEMSRGTLPISDNFNRNQVSVGFDYQFKAFPIGR